MLIIPLLHCYYWHLLLPNNNICTGRCNQYGIGVIKNEAEAVKYYTLAADQDHTEAQYRLGDHKILHMFCWHCYGYY